MEHLTTLDAGFLEAEDSDRHVSLAIGGLAVMEGPAPDHASLVSVLAERVSEIPRFTQVVRTHPLDLAAPEWVDDPQFDLAHHVHRIALPQPGNDAALYRVVADIMERRLDRDRPLWESWTIEGLAENRWAVLTKLHHCIADGISATRLLAGLCDGADAETFANRIRAARRVAGASSVWAEPESAGLGWWHLAPFHRHHECRRSHSGRRCSNRRRRPESGGFLADRLGQQSAALQRSPSPPRRCGRDLP